VRAGICAGLEWLGVGVDDGKNSALTNGAEGRFDKDGSRAQLWVIPTDEELLIARDTWRVVTGADVRY
jgi:acetate kinase